MNVIRIMDVIGIMNVIVIAKLRFPAKKTKK